MQGMEGNNRVILHGLVAARPVGKAVIFESATERTNVDAVFFGRAGAGASGKGACLFGAIVSARLPIEGEILPILFRKVPAFRAER
jgi:hypothetical protein